MDWKEREKKQLEIDEGRKLEAYKDTLGNWTIGVGHFGDVTPGQKITNEECDELLDQDFTEALESAKRVCDSFDSLDDARKGVLVNMAFNLGEKNLAGFHNFLALVNRHEFGSAAWHMKSSLWCRQVGNRALRLAKRMETGVYE